MYTLEEIENYNTYMDWVRLRIKYDVENGTTSDITLGHIILLEGGEWLFEYKLKKWRRYKTIRLINFDAWTREQKTEERNRRIDELLDGLREDHKEQLIEELYRIDLSILVQNNIFSSHLMYLKGLLYNKDLHHPYIHL